MLRGHTAADLDAIAAMWADPEVTRHITGVPSTREESWARLLRYAGLWPLLGFGYWLVEDRATGRFLGEVGFANFQRDIEPVLATRWRRAGCFIPPHTATALPPKRSRRPALGRPAPGDPPLRLHDRPRERRVAPGRAEMRLRRVRADDLQGRAYASVRAPLPITRANSSAASGASRP